MKKRDVLELLRDMPDEIDTEELIYRLYVREKLERSEASAEAGGLIDQEDLEREIEEWLA